MPCFKNKPQAVMMSFQREYAESYDWLDENEGSLYRQGMLAFGGVAPTYHTELRERPNLVWDFNSLLLCIQMMFSFMLTDDDSSLKVCKHCSKAFAATRSNMEFCSPQCKNQYNVLSIDQMAELFQRDRSVIGIHEKRVIFSQEADN